MTDQAITLTFNGRPTEVPRGTTITQLLEIGEIRASVVAVERNKEIVPREQHATTEVEAGDTIEAVTLVGGG
ncbi:MAG TPA: thiamine biosynthesis protein ThiS [Planctomycetaceae bacterium]|nr:thiamine biosynthesis protein ThiS [Planctomycetaceae bacterium]